MASVKITKTMAHVAAIRLADAQYEERIAKARKDLMDYTEVIVEYYCPTPIIQVAKEYQSYIYCTKSAVVISPNENVEVLNLNFNLPYRTTIEVSQEVFDHVIELRKKISKEYELKHESQKKWEQIIIGLGTLKRMQEQLPDAVEYVTWPTVKALSAVQYDDCKTILQEIKKKKQNENKTS